MGFFIYNGDEKSEQKIHGETLGYPNINWWWLVVIWSIATICLYLEKSPKPLDVNFSYYLYKVKGKIYV